MGALKKYFDTHKEALTVRDVRNKYTRSNGVFKMKHGRNKGKFFVGSEMEYLNLP